MSCRRAERSRAHGVALLAAVAGTAFVAMVAVGAGRWTLAGTRLAASTADALQAEAAIRSGIAVAGVLLEEHAATGEPDTLAALLAPQRLERRLGRGAVRIEIEDAARRLDLGAPELAPAVRRLFAALELPPGLAETLADWVDADDAARPHGAERDWYLSRRPALLPANAPLGALSELAFVRGFDAAAIARLRPHVAVAGARAVNPNTAAPPVLAAWLGDEAAARSTIARRERGVVACLGMPACTTRSGLYLVHVRARVHGVRRGAEAVLWVAAAGPYEVRAVRPEPS